MARPHQDQTYIIDYKNGTILRGTTNHPSFFPPPNDTVVQSKDITINIASYACQLPALIFLPAQPDSNQRIPVLVYFHGSAFCISSPFSKGDTVYMAREAAKAHVITLSLDYILHTDGAILDSYDSWAFFKWVIVHKFKAHLLRSDPWLAHLGDLDQMFVGGDSVGGNIAYRMAIQAELAQLPWLC